MPRDLDEGCRVSSVNHGDSCGWHILLRARAIQTHDWMRYTAAMARNCEQSRLKNTAIKFVVCGLCVFVSIESFADVKGTKRKLTKAEQQQVARFLKEFRDAKELEDKAAFVDQAIAHGESYVDALKRSIESQGKNLYGSYPESFVAAIPGTPIIAPNSIVASDEKLTKQRALIVGLHKWFNKLKEATDKVGANPKPADAERGDEPNETGKGIDDQLRDFEESLVKKWLYANGYRRITIVEQTLIQQVNIYRKQEGVEPLVVDYRLCIAARDHSYDMVAKRFFSHNSKLPNKKSYWVRAKRFGTIALSENIANNPNPSQVVPMWKTSSAHKRNMLNPRAYSVGVGRAGNKYTMLFGPKLPEVTKEENAIR